MTQDLLEFWGKTLRSVELNSNIASLLPKEEARFLVEIGLPTNEIILVAIQELLKTSVLPSNRTDEDAIRNHPLYFQFMPNSIETLITGDYTFIVIGQYSSGKLAIKSNSGGVYVIFDLLEAIDSDVTAQRVLFLNTTLKSYLRFMELIINFLLRTNNLRRQYGELLANDEPNDKRAKEIIDNIRKESTIMLKNFQKIDTSALTATNSWWIMHLQLENYLYAINV